MSLAIVLLIVSVAPFTGAWIETPWRTGSWLRRRVAPFTGAWIETLIIGHLHTSGCVAPFTGAWIETWRY